MAETRVCRRYDRLRLRGRGKARDQEPPRLGTHLRQEHRDQPEGRAGDVVHRFGLRRAAPGRRMSVAETAVADGARRDERRAMGVACGAHALHDGYTDLVYVMLPIWQGEFGLSYAAVGALRGVLAGTMAGFQIPAGFLSERLGTPLVLAARTALAGLGLCLAILTGSAAALAAILVITGLGA